MKTLLKYFFGLSSFLMDNAVHLNYKTELFLISYLTESTVFSMIIHNADRS